MDAFGIQHVDIVTQSNQYTGRAALFQKRNMRTAMGSAKWLTVTNYASTQEAIQTIRSQYNCRFFASDLHPNAVDIRSIDWSNPIPSCSSSSSSSANKENENSNNRIHNKNDLKLDASKHNDRPICIVMGNEDSGISDMMRQYVDVLFTLPMVGFAESFNLSVATAIVLAHLSAMSRIQSPKARITPTIAALPEEDESTDTRVNERSSCTTPNWTGPIRPGDLTKREYDCLYFKALINSLPQKRMARGMLQTVCITLPKDLDL
jgi:SpoU rRNA Methylase family